VPIEKNHSLAPRAFDLRLESGVVPARFKRSIPSTLWDGGFFLGNYLKLGVVFDMSHIYDYKYDILKM